MSKWSLFREANSHRYSFDKIGAPDFYVKMLHPGIIPYGKLLSLFPEGETGDSKEEDQKKSLSSLAYLIVEWNLTNPETDEPLEVPTEQNYGVLQLLPTAFMRMLFAWEGDLMQELQNDVPMKSESE